MTTTTGTTTAPPTAAEYARHCRWAVQPVGTYRQMWVHAEACHIRFERTGTFSPWPSLEDLAEADRRIPTDATV